MSVVINSNYAATVASNNLAASNEQLARSLNRLSSGSKIVNPADDAGGLAVSMKLSAAARRQGATQANIGNATSFLQTQDGAYKVASKVLDRMAELSTLYTDGTKTADDIANYATEFTALNAELTKLGLETFNGNSVFGSFAVAGVTIAARDFASSIGTVTIGSASSIDTAIKNVATDRAENGAEQSRLGYAAELTAVNKANLEAANSRIVDVDIAQESTQLARWNIMVQAGTAMLAQANQSSQSALRLIS